MVRMRYLVTGGAGFIGSNTVDELVRRGESVVVLDDLSAGKEDNLAESRNKISFIKGSINDIEAIRRSMHEADYVIHLAARTSVARRSRRQSKTRGPRRFLFRLRRDADSAQSRNHAARTDFSLRR